MTITKKQIQYGAIGVCLLAAALIAYFTFSGHGSSTPPVSSVTPTPTAEITQSGTAPGDVGDTSASGSASDQQSINLNRPFLPNGADLDDSAFQDPRFKFLIPPVYPTVDPSEIGNPNPFDDTNSAAPTPTPLPTPTPGHR